MNDFSDEELHALADLLINQIKGRKATLAESTAFKKIDSELTQREEVAGLDFECDSCTL